MGTNNASAAGAGYLVTYDPSTKKVTRLTAKGFDSPRGLSPFGMDIVPSTHNPDELTIYVINMRPPLVDLDPNLPPGVREEKRDEVASARSKKEGPDPSIEVFRYVLGGDTVQYVATWTDENIVISPNDVVGLPDGKGAWFTNTLPYRSGIVRPTLFTSLLQLALIFTCSSLNRETQSPPFSNKSTLLLGFVPPLVANSLRRGSTPLTGSHDPLSPRMIPSTLLTPSLAA